MDRVCQCLLLSILRARNAMKSDLKFLFRGVFLFVLFFKTKDRTDNGYSFFLSFYFEIYSCIPSEKCLNKK